jgi:Ca2+-binding RTX toxin-like protein
MAIITGTNGNDIAPALFGTEAADEIYGLAGNDGLVGLAGDDLLDGGDGNDLLEGGAGNDMLQGGAGMDTATFLDSYNHVPVTVDLITGIAQGGATLGSDRLVSIENVEGTLYDDQLLGTNLANVLQGASGADMLAGRGGADRFVYVQTYDSLVSASDHIQDFSSKQGDRIDLSAVETNEQSGGDPDFKFIGQKDFTEPGQVRFSMKGDHTVVEVNTTDESAGAEMQIILDPKVSLKATDFVL